ncbi:hypothetical protein NQ315_016319 [Exocentrus adspersus]|uniref:Uncharacterized protein n=1 Tax=Exocentrus adspersus TaxID=1586481 RepID=A0AAV8VQ63_9CUCU|nr:hypothetical protein NQ315_016319 [Exocentrus adspersus]
MDSSFSSEVRKSNFEELSKEELLKKCKGLLTIAQKAKQAKDLLQEENAKLKQELASKVEIRVSEELVETLTQQKLSLVTAIEDLKARNSSLDSKLQIYEQELKTCQEKLDKADNESVSYKRQVTRLTDENEQLLTHLDSLEKQIDELNKIGIQQRKQLLELESKAQGQGNVTDENRFTELQCMLSVSLDEVKKLKSQNIGLNEKVDNVNMALSEKNKNMLILGEDLKTNCHTLEKVNKELDLLQDMKKELEAKLAELQSRNDKLKEKLKLYHSKIIKLAGTTKGLKEEKEAILELFKRYTDQVKDWKEQLNNAVKGLVEHIGVIHYENRKLKADLKQKFDFDMEKVLNETVMKYEAQLGSLRNENEAVKNKLEGSEVRCTSLHQAVKESRKNIDEYKIQMDVLQTENENLDKDLVSQKNLNAQLVEELAAIKGENVRLAKDLGEFEAKCSSLNKEMKSLLDSNKELKNEINLLVNEKKSGNMIIKEKDAASNKQMEEYQSMLLDNEKLICDLQVQLKSYEYDREHVKATEMKLAEKSSEEIIKLVEEKKKY